MQRVHFIGIGEPDLSALAIAVSKKNNFTVTGSDCYVAAEQAAALKNAGILPDDNGWFPEKIKHQLTAVVLGYNVKADNPEYIKAKESGLKIFSFAEYFFHQTRSKTRIVVAGQDEKPLITAMMLHVLKLLKIEVDYAFLSGKAPYGERVRLTYDSRIALFEMDESLISPVKGKLEFCAYKPHIVVFDNSVLNNVVDKQVFYEDKKDKYRCFLDTIEVQGRLIYSALNNDIGEITEKLRRDIVSFAYDHPDVELTDGQVRIKTRKHEIETLLKPAQLPAVQAAYLACKQIGVSEEQFYSQIAGFESNEG